jgi:hypothetical protein
LAVVYTVLNGVKPLQVDDAAYYYYARQIAEHPLDPYGFEIFWYERPLPAADVLAPPLLPYWWAVAIRLFGERPLLWKLWLLPFSLLFVWSLAALFRRFARGLELPLTVMTLLSPTFLPSLNLMLDVPALALALAGIVLFLRARDRDSVPLAAAAGLAAGFAMQTKYTGFLGPTAMVLYAVVLGALTPAYSRRGALRPLLLATIAALVAGLVFVAWEGWVVWRYGESHFLHEYRHADHDLGVQLRRWSLPLLVLLGCVHGVGLPLGLAGLGRRPRIVAATGIAIAACFVLLATGQGLVSVSWTIDPALGGADVSWAGTYSQEELIFEILGLAVVAVTCAVAYQLLRVGSGGLWRPRIWRRRRLDWFLVLWLGLEVAGYFALTPFGAVRRIMGLVVVATLLAGRLASRTCRSGARRALVRGVAVFNVVLGLGYYAVDFCDAWGWKAAADGAAAVVRQQDPGAHIWYVGHWGFQFYAEHAGMRPVIPGDSGRPLRRGDWLVIPDDRLNRQAVRIDWKRTEPVADLAVLDHLPLRTVQGFYGTGTGVALAHHRGPRVGVTIYRVIADFVPALPELWL